jgi:regulatory protein YycH of two-component signal transduction system YycFG
MSTQDFTTTFSVDQTPKKSFDAINDVRGWWTGDITGSADKLGDEFTYRYKQFHFSRQRVTEFVSGRKVAWLVLESALNFVNDKAEWNGTKIFFAITKRGDKTEVCFTHTGLWPDLECFRGCSSAWSSLIKGSLRKLIATGERSKEEP